MERGIRIHGCCTFIIMSCMFLSCFLLYLLKTHYCHPCGKTQETMNFKLTTSENLKMVADGISLEAQETTQLEDEDEDEPHCSKSSSTTFTCRAQGDIRVHASSRTIFINHAVAPPLTTTKIKPYPRNADTSSPALLAVKEWTFTSGAGAPWCTHNHTAPALVFSAGGFAGNLFHDFADVLVPLFTTTSHFSGEVHLLVTDSKPSWVTKFLPFLHKLTTHIIIDADRDGDGVVRCFPAIIAGLEFHKELIIDASRTHTNCSMSGLREMLRQAFNLPRRNTSPATPRRNPKLLIVSRKGTRRFLNEAAMSAAAREIGFEVAVGDPAASGEEIGEFARMANSADVMVGAHGAGMTNMVFLPDRAAVVQVVPFGELRWLAGATFGGPAAAMGLRHVEYDVAGEESTLPEKYPEVLEDPLSARRRGGWEKLRSVYLDGQDLKPDIGRLGKVLREVLGYLEAQKP